MRGFFGSLNLAKNLSNIPFPKPIRLNAQSTPKIGTIAKSILSKFTKLEFFASKIFSLFFFKGKRNGTILNARFAFVPFCKINGRNILIFFCFFK